MKPSRASGDFLLRPEVWIAGAGPGDNDKKPVAKAAIWAPARIAGVVAGATLSLVLVLLGILLASGAVGPASPPPPRPPPPPPPPPSPSPPLQPPLQASQVLVQGVGCTVRLSGVEVSRVGNGDCEDGGLGSVSAVCPFGTDPGDCPLRYTTKSPPPSPLPSPPGAPVDSLVVDVFEFSIFANTSLGAPLPDFSMNKLACARRALAAPQGRRLQAWTVTHVVETRLRCALLHMLSAADAMLSMESQGVDTVVVRIMEPADGGRTLSQLNALVGDASFALDLSQHAAATLVINSGSGGAVALVENDIALYPPPLPSVSPEPQPPPPPSPPPPTTPAPSPPPPVGESPPPPLGPGLQTACTDDCSVITAGGVQDLANDGFCDDGVENIVQNLCYVGTDCTDCGVRSVPRLSPPSPTPPPPAPPSPPPASPSPPPLSPGGKYGLTTSFTTLIGVECAAFNVTTYEQNLSMPLKLEAGSEVKVTTDCNTRRARALISGVWVTTKIVKDTTNLTPEQIAELTSLIASIDADDVAAAANVPPESVAAVAVPPATILAFEAPSPPPPSPPLAKKG